MASESSRKRLPFEPKKKRQGADKSSVEAASSAKNRSKKSEPSKAKAKSKTATKSRPATASTGIPEEVSKRMLRRMLTFSGVPTALGITVFFASYFLIIRDVVELPTYFVLLTTLGCFGLGVLGLSYGALSASWDEDRLGQWFGFDEFKTNFGRMTAAWRSRADS
jgi:hypothetical protein